MSLDEPTDDIRLHIELPGDDYHRNLISCQVACPVHTDARGYVRAIAEGRFEEAYRIARDPNPMASICGPKETRRWWPQKEKSMGRLGSRGPRILANMAKGWIRR